MEKFELHKNENCVYYMSSQCRTWAPAKSILVFAPNSVARSISRLETFAANSGWLQAGEEDGAVVIFPVAPQGWESETTDRIKGLYKTVWKDTVSPDPRESIRNVWCWETLIFAVGYDEGAAFAGNAAVDHPNAFAQVILVNGVPGCYDGGAHYSDRWLVPDASEDWKYRNKEIPVAVWMLGDQDTSAAEAYFSRLGEDLVTVTPGTFGPDPETTRLLLAEMNTRIRWKNSPDGTPARLKPKTLVDTDGEYLPRSVVSNGINYDYYVRLPRGAATAKGLPVVVSIHGHGEPAWMFAQKNGWPELQDETGEFLFVSPDSPEHTWLVERDEGMQEKMLDQLEQEFGIDRTRVYLTGFSNGALATCWYGTRHPQLYAALSPWNSPVVAFEDRLINEGWEMPMFAINGDLDHKMDNPRKRYPELFRNWITLNGGKPRKAEIPKPLPWKCDEIWGAGTVYTKQAGYTQGNRLTTYVYHNLDGQCRFCYTELRNMPHGAIADEARAAWHFMKRFARPRGSKRVTDSQQADLEPMLDFHQLPSGGSALVYVPTSANSYTPSRSLVLLPGSEDGKDAGTVTAWLKRTGWIRQANRDGSVLLVPFSNGCWKKQSVSMIKELYRACWGKTKSREQGNVLWERGLDTGGKIGNVWMWEVLWSIIGYDDGAVFAGAAAARYPNRFASVTLLGGAPTVFPGHEVKSDHFLVSKEEGKNPDRMVGVSADYDVRVDEISSAVWILAGEAESAPAAAYFRKTAGVAAEAGKAETFCGLPSVRWQNSEFPAHQVIVSVPDRYPTPQELMDQWIGGAIRWKNGPDGTLQRFWWKDEIESGVSPYEKQSFRYPTEERNRDYYVYRPVNLPPKAPVVITIHGHGEPAWMFISKNGWPQLADQEGILIVSPQDNSENRWHGEDDTQSFAYLVDDILCRYDVDPERIYISGFSNGNFQCYSAACAHPELFAAMWPMSQAACSSKMRGLPETEGNINLQRLWEHGLEMPLFGVTGDNDGWAVEGHTQNSDLSKTIEVFLKLAGTEPHRAETPNPLYWQPDEIRDQQWYKDNFQFREADRFMTWVYHNNQGQPRVCITVMKNMPHGTIWEETVAAWDFMKHFSRKADGKIIYR